MDFFPGFGYLVRMMQPISGKQAPVDAARSIDAMSRILENAQAQSGRLNEKLLKTGMEEKVRDSALGNNVDVTA